MSPDVTEHLPQRVEAIDVKLDALSLSVGARFDDVEQRFGEVSLAFVEQREYTEFAFERLRREMLERFDRIGTRLDHLEARVGSLEARFTSLEVSVDGGFKALAEKLDRLIDGQARLARRRQLRKKTR